MPKANNFGMKSGAKVILKTGQYKKSMRCKRLKFPKNAESFYMGELANGGYDVFLVFHMNEGFDGDEDNEESEPEDATSELFKMGYKMELAEDSCLLKKEKPSPTLRKTKKERNVKPVPKEKADLIYKAILETLRLNRRLDGSFVVVKSLEDLKKQGEVEIQNDSFWTNLKKKIMKELGISRSSVTLFAIKYGQNQDLSNRRAGFKMALKDFEFGGIKSFQFAVAKDAEYLDDDVILLATDSMMNCLKAERDKAYMYSKALSGKYGSFAITGKETI
jgi:hypothetical protein